MAVKKIAGSEITKVAAASDKLVLVDFSATWCGPCKILEPVLEKVSEELSQTISVYAIDVDASPVESGKFGIRGVPTMILFHKGVEIDRMVGFRDKGALVNHLSRIADDKLGV
jgi:thioredoxin 1